MNLKPISRLQIWSQELNVTCDLTVGARDFTPLPADAVPAGRDSGGSERRQQHSGETGQEQATAAELRERREAGPRAQGRQIRGVLGSHAGTWPARRHMNNDHTFILKAQFTDITT